MDRIEEGTRHLGQPELAARLARGELATVILSRIPPKIKDPLRRLVFGERARYPLQEPIVVEMAGQKARFWIRNHSDWLRIGRGGFETEYGQLMIAIIAEMDHPTFVDIGAAQGLYTILAAQAGSRVLAIDPDPISHQSLLENLALNAGIAGRVETMAVALGAEQGELKLYIDPDGEQAPSLIKTVPGLKEVITVPMTTLDILISEGKIPPPDVVKIDVEGAEGLVLAGMKELLLSPKKPRVLFVEIHCKYLPGFGSTGEEVEEIIRQSGYQLKNHWYQGGQKLCCFEASSV